MKMLGGSLEKQLDQKTFLNILYLIQVNLVKMIEVNYLIKMIRNNKQIKIKQSIVNKKKKYFQS